MRSIVAAFSGPVWLRTGSASAASTAGATGVGPGIMSSGGVVMSRPMLPQRPCRRRTPHSHGDDGRQEAAQALDRVATEGGDHDGRVFTH